MNTILSKMLDSVQLFHLLNSPSYCTSAKYWSVITSTAEQHHLVVFSLRKACTCGSVRSPSSPQLLTVSRTDTSAPSTLNLFFICSMHILTWDLYCNARDQKPSHCIHATYMPFLPCIPSEKQKKHMAAPTSEAEGHRHLKMLLGLLDNCCPWGQLSPSIVKSGVLVLWSTSIEYS